LISIVKSCPVKRPSAGDPRIQRCLCDKPPRMNRPILRNFLSLTVLHAAHYAIPLVTIPYLTRILGASGFGNLATAQAAIQYFALLVDFGFNLSSSRLIAAHRNDRAYISGVFWSTIYAKGTLVLLSTGLLYAISFLPILAHIRPAIWANFTAVLGTWLFPTWLFQGLERMATISLINIGARLAALPLLFLFVKSPNDMYLAALILGGTALLAGMVGFIAALRLHSLSLVPFSWRATTGRLAESWPLFLSTAGTSLYSASNIILLRTVASPVDVGYFAGADKIRVAVIGLIPLMTNAIFPTAVTSPRPANRSLFAEFRRFWPKLVLGLAVFTILFFGARTMVWTALGAMMSPSASVLRVFAFLGLIIPFNHILGIHVLVAHGHSKEFSRAVLVGGASNFLFLPLLGRAFGADGAALALILVELTVFAVLLYSYHQLTTMRAPLEPQTGIKR